MKYLLFTLSASLVILMSSCSKKAHLGSNQAHSFYIGTYTSDGSEGIYKATLQSNGILSPATLVAKTTDPSFLALSKDKKYLLAVNEIEDGTVQSYKITNSGLSMINQSASGGAHPCHITAHKSGHVLTSNYTSGSVGLLKLQNDGSLSQLLYEDKHAGSGDHERQDGPHAHSSYFINDDEIVSVDLGTNDLWFSRLDKKSTTLESTYKLQMKANAGPRHLVIHPDKKTLLVVNELDCTISLLQKAKDNKYSVQSTISTLPTDYTDANSCADLHISEDGKHAYVSNRGHNSIAIFEIDAKGGEIKALGHESTKGKKPRNFAISPDGNHLLVANQTTNNIVSFQRDVASGLLTYVMETEAFTPVCIIFE